MQRRPLLPLFHPARLRAPASLDAGTRVERRTAKERPRVEQRTAEKRPRVEQRKTDERRCGRQTPCCHQRRRTKPGRRTRHGASASTQAEGEEDRHATPSHPSSCQRDREEIHRVPPPTPTKGELKGSVPSPPRGSIVERHVAMSRERDGGSGLAPLPPPLGSMGKPRGKARGEDGGAPTSCETKAHCPSPRERREFSSFFLCF